MLVKFNPKVIANLQPQSSTSLLKFNNSHSSWKIIVRQWLYSAAIAETDTHFNSHLLHSCVWYHAQHIGSGYTSVFSTVFASSMSEDGQLNEGFGRGSRQIRETGGGCLVYSVTRGSLGMTKRNGF